MICPTCKSDMVVIEYNEIELDYCTNCRGVWFDSGELTLLLNSIDIEHHSHLLHDIVNIPEAKSAEDKRKCPICNRKMKKTTIGQQPEILIDVCDQEDGLWFDGGEVHQLISHLAEKQSPETDSQQDVLNYLGEVFKAQD